ncbi:MAG TPA: cytochrome c maturation protein CcmE [Vicinamibacteria bacterium]|nr:cytochrome c maturation protein CcmE [Vicinamibacteria bacterium]
MTRKKLKFLAGSVVVLGAVMGLAISGLEESKSYYQTVTELKAMGSKAEGVRVRVAGNVVPGSIERHEQGVVTFDIDFEGDRLPVRYVGRAPLPDTLVDRAQAVAEGKLIADGRFEATAVQAKCASKYEAAYEQSKTGATE